MKMINDDLLLALKRYGSICKEPDWPKTFLLPEDIFDELQARYKSYPIFSIESGFSVIRLDAGYMIRREDTRSEFKDLYKELSEKENSTKSTDL